MSRREIAAALRMGRGDAREENFARARIIVMHLFGAGEERRASRLRNFVLRKAGVEVPKYFRVGN